jgi:ribosomal protein S24E
MSIEIIEEKENPLFKRRELVAAVNFASSATPSKMALQKALADQLKVGADSVEITKIISENGLPRGKAWIKIWHEKKVPIYTEKKAAAPAEAT